MTAQWLRMARVLGMLTSIVGFSALDLSTSTGQEPTGLEAAQAIEKLLVDSIAAAEKSVVAITRIRRDAPGLDTVEFDDDRLPLRGFRVDRTDPDSPDFVPVDYGTGVIVSRDGLIVTNYHVLGDPAKSAYWVWVDRRPFPAKVRAADPWTDLAVLKIDADRLDPITFGEGGEVRKGQFVVGLGNPYAMAQDGQPSATWGIVSNLARKLPRTGPREFGRAIESLHHYGTLIQTDTRLPLGTSGGALLNLRGEMIGLTTSLAAFEGSETSAGFAIPVDATFRKTVDVLKSGRTPDFGFLGVSPSLLALPERQQGEPGVRVNNVVPGTPAHRAGLQSDDRITHVQGFAVHGPSDLIREVSGRYADQRIELTIERGSDRRSTQILKLSATLSKKYTAGGRRPVAEFPDSTWRGVRVDYSTAVPEFQNWVGRLDPDGCVAVLEVERDSAAWKAGIRPLSFISHINGQRVVTPTEFHRIATKNQGPARVQLTGAANEILTISD